MGFSAPIKALYGIYQTHQASKALRDLAKQPDPQYRSAIDIKNEAEAVNQRGFSAQEEADFGTSLARMSNARLRSARDMNPNLANAVTAGINFGNLGALNKFAADSARLRENKVNRLAGDITQQSNANVSEAIRRKREKEMAYGEAYKAGISNISNMFEQIDRDAASVTAILTGMPAGGNVTPIAQAPARLGATDIPSQGAQNAYYGSPQRPYPGSQQWTDNLYPSPGNPYNINAPMSPTAPLGNNPPAASAVTPDPFSYDWYRNSLGF